MLFGTTYIGTCSGPAKRASLLFSLYFSTRDAPSSTIRSSRGCPTTRRRGELEDMAEIKNVRERRQAMLLFRDQEHTTLRKAHSRSQDLR